MNGRRTPGRGAVLLAPLLLVLVVPLAAPDGAHADGVIGTAKLLSVGEVMERSSIVAVARVTRVAHRFADGKAYGRRTPVLTWWRFQVSITEIFKGADELPGGERLALPPLDAEGQVVTAARRGLEVPPAKPAARPKPIVAWLEKENPNRLSAWRYAEESFGLIMDTVKKGQTVVVFASSQERRRRPPRLDLNYLLGAEGRPGVLKALVGEAARLRTRFRAKAPCTDPMTFQLGGRCQPLAAVVKAHPCATATAGAKVAGTKHLHGARGGLEVWCEQDGLRHGLGRVWGGQGLLREATWWVAGTRHGLTTTYHPGTEQKRLEGHYDHGVRTGLWQQWSKNGRLLGQYTLEGGTGTVRQWHENGTRVEEYSLVKNQRHGLWRRWHENGQLARRQEYHRGKEHGPHRAWDHDGEVWLKGAYRRGKEHGPWINYKAGKIDIVTCYRRGVELWDSVMTEGKTARSRCP